MDSISPLRDMLSSVMSGRESHHTEQELFDELMVQKPRLVSPLDVGGRNQQEQREIESGKITIDGKRVAVNSDFARQALFLSQQLDCSERYVAGILDKVTSENPNLSPVDTLEKAVAEFHQRRRLLVECVCELVEATRSATAPDAHPSLERLANFVENELIHGCSGQGLETWALRMFRTVDGLEDVLLKADNARQSARSHTTLPSGQGNPALAYHVLNSRYESLKYERRKLATALCGLSQLGVLTPNDIKSVIDWLQRNPNHAMTFYMLTTVLFAFASADPQSKLGQDRHLLATNPQIISYMKQTFGPTKEWQDSGMQATILLKWTLFLTEARHNDPNLEGREGFRTEDLETQIWNAVQGDAFTYLALAVIQLQQRQGKQPASSIAGTLSLSSEQREHRLPPSDDFKLSVLLAFERLVRSLITHASSELRKIKQRQEDLVLASARTDRRTASRFSTGLVPAETEKSSPPPRSDIAVLYAFIGLLYSSLPPESALQFWGAGPQGDASGVSYWEYIEATAGRLPTFLQFAVWSTSVHDITMSTALYDMLGGLAKGQQCSELAYNFMVRGSGEVIPGSMLPSSSSGGPSVSWSVVFGLLEAWASASTNSRHQSQQQQSLGFSTTLGSLAHSAQAPPPSSNQLVIRPKDVFLAQSFLHLLATVVTHSVAVRIAISGHTHFRAIPTLVSLIPLGIPLELKGALFETLSAFCEPGAGVPGVEICKAVWMLMEKLEVINVRTTPTGPFGAILPALKGVEAELQEIEAVHRTYPSTIPFLKLLSTLIHTPKRVPIKDRLTELQPTNTIPETLGQPYRLPGIAPFTSFVIDNVFANIPNREYSRASDRWQTNALCLAFIERSLASFDLESLVTTANGAPLKAESLVPLLVHPGYDIMKRLLTNSPLQASILSYIVEGINGFEKELPLEEPFFCSTIIRVLRIVHRVLEVQDIFLDVLIPLLLDLDSTPIVGTVHPRSYFTKFDQALSFGPQYIPAITAYIAYPTYPELALLSIRIVSILSSSSSSSSNLATLIYRSSDSERIITAFTDVLDVETLDDVAEAELLAEETTGAGAPDLEENTELTQAIRLAALDLLIQETEPSSLVPNVGMVLLFGELDIKQIQDPHALGAGRTSIHVLLQLLNGGIPRFKNATRTHDYRHTTPLFISLPALAERCYRVVHQLCTHHKTFDFTTRYMRTQEDFFARQLAYVPPLVPHTTHDSYIQLQYQDGSRVTTTVSSASSFLRLRSCIFDLVALDLHILTNKGHLKGVSELLDILFGHGSDCESDDDTFQPFREVGQSHMRIIELLQSLSFEWFDSLAVEPMELQFLGQLNLLSCVRRDFAGCEVIDRRALLALLSAAKRALHAQGVIVTPANGEQLQREATYILESCVVENHRREVAHSIATGYEAWRRLLDMALMKSFDRLPHDRRENMLFDLLHVVPAIIRSPDIEESTAILLSEVVLSSITKLREDRRQQIIAQSASGNAESGSLPAERLYSILHSIQEGILDNNRVELVRGNLYASLINYVHLVACPGEETSAYAHKGGENLALSLAMSTTREDFFFDGNQSLVSLDRGGRSEKSLAVGSLAALKGSMERLVASISRDAIDGTEVWKTVAFMLLDALVQLSGAEKQPSVLSSLNRHGILANFVRGVKESDSRLLAVLKPDPDDLNVLYVYEAKMSLFVRMTQTRAGAERLLEAQLVPVLAQCDYLDARPETDQSFIDRDSFLPSAVQRYHQLFMPALQVVDGMLATLSNKHATITNQALDFLSSHSSTIVILLKNDMDYVPLSLLEEIHLLVTSCASVLPSVPKSEMLSSNSGFGAIHAAILNLATRCLGGGRCFAHIIPQSDAEMQRANTYAFGYGSESNFNVSVRQGERLLRKSIVAYIGSASDFTEPEITLVLSPITTPQHRHHNNEQSHASHFLTTIPTIGDSLEALNALCAELTETLQQISNLTAELAARDYIAVDNIQEVVKDIPVSLLQDLDVAQKRELICEEMGSVRRAATREARVLLDTTEMLLLVIWRHIQHYTSPSFSLPSAPGTSATTTAAAANLSSSTLFNPSGSRNAGKQNNILNAAMRFLAAPDPETFKEEVGRKLGPLLGRLEGLDLTLDFDGDVRNWNEGYIEIMGRRLRDSLGLLHDPGRDDE